MSQIELKSEQLMDETLILSAMSHKVSYEHIQKIVLHNTLIVYQH